MMLRNFPQPIFYSALCIAIAIVATKLSEQAQGEIRPYNTQIQDIQTKDTMEELTDGQTLIYNDLTLVHKGGGHKITADEHGKRSGDLSFADVVLKMNGDQIQHRFFAPTTFDKPPFIFGPYRISVHKMSWNGESVLLKIEKSE